MRSIGFVLSTDNENRMITALVLNSIPTEALVDSGATLSMVHQKWLIDSGISFHAMPERSIFGFGCGSRVKLVGAVVLNLEIHGLLLKPTMFYVVLTDAEFNVPVILAVDMLKENNLVVDIQRMRLSQRHDDGSSVDYYAGSNSAPCRLIYRNVACSVTERAVVPAGETMALPIAPRYPMRNLTCCPFCPSFEEEMFYFEENLDLNNLQAYPGIFTPGESAFTVLVLASDTSEEIAVGDVIGTISSVIFANRVEPAKEVSVASLPSGTDEALCDDDLDFDVSIAQSTRLSDDQRKVVHDILLSCSGVFSLNDSDIGYMGVTEHRIELWDDTPIYQKPRRLPEPVSQEIEAQCKELQLLDIIEPSMSPWSSPVVPVRKKDGKIRLCIDYRRLNAVMKADRFSLPNLTDAVFSLYGVTYFTSLDLVRGYYQFSLAEESRELTAFSTTHSHWQFKRLSFGLKNAPAAFQREMQQVLSGFPWH